MRVSRGIVCCLVVFVMGIMPCVLKAEEFKIAVLQDDRFSVQNYQPLVEHLAKAGIRVSLVEAPTYQSIAKMLASGEVDAMFNGPGIPGSMITIYHLKQNRLFSSFKQEGSKVQQAMSPQNRIN
jgi:ABC-type phosphate/phosphonate transport system substrate-binding protein